MRCIKTTVAAACAMLALTAGAATAQTVSDRKTFVTFSGPVSVPGTTLPAGTYTFKILDSQTNRNVVQIFDKDGMKLITTLLAVAATRPEASGDPVITFKETPSDRPPAVHFWYYAGETAGNELVYPKGQAIMIANASGESVMSVDSSGTTIDDWKSGTMSRVNPSTTSADTSTASTASTTSTASTASTTSTATSTATTTADTTTAQPPPAPKPSTTTATSTATTTTADQPSTPPPARPTTAPPSTSLDQTAQPSVTPAPAPTTEPSVPPSTPDTAGTSGRLPNTASNLPLVGLIGLLALGGAVALRVARTA
jgi:hypothetical protein